MSTERTIVLDQERIALILERFAHEIHERYHTESELVLIGIEGRGYEVAERVLRHLKQLSSAQIRLEKIALNKTHPMSEEVNFSMKSEALNEKVVILVDDVLNSGRTLMYATCHILQARVRAMTTVVVVDRIHRSFPIKADIVGLTLSTTLQERVELELGEEDYAYLI